MTLPPRNRTFAPAQAFLVSFAVTLFVPIDAVIAGSAANTWRCGNAYSDQPCNGGRLVDTDDQRSAETRRDADAATRRIERQAETMARERERLEHAGAARGSVTLIADPRVAERRERLALQAAQRKIDREDEARRQPHTVHDRRKKVRSGS